MNELILGLLLINNLTSYEIKKALKNGMSMIASDSMGAIHISIKKLLKSNYITVEECTNNGRLKKIYSITNEGRKYFELWVNSSIEVSSKRNSELRKLFFMAFSDEENRKLRIEKYIDDIKFEKYKLEQIKEHSINKLNKLPDEYKEIAFFQMQTIQYGLDCLDFDIAWYQSLLSKL